MEKMFVSARFTVIALAAGCIAFLAAQQQPPAQQPPPVPIAVPVDQEPPPADARQGGRPLTEAEEREKQIRALDPLARPDPNQTGTATGPVAQPAPSRRDDNKPLPGS